MLLKFLSVWLITTGERRVNGLFCHPRCFYDRSWNWHLSFCEERMVAFTSRKRTATNFSLQYQEGLYMMSGYISDCLGENFSCIQPKPILPQKFNWDVFMATLIPTEGCNFQCSYCHKNHPAASMTRDTLDRIEEYITAQAPRYKQVILAWFGGEPTLCKDTVLEVSTLCKICRNSMAFTMLPI